MANGQTNRGYKELFEDWVGAVNIGTSATTAGIEWVNSSDSGDTAFAPFAHATDGPIARAVVSTTDAHMCELGHRSVAWSAQNGELTMKTRVRVAVGAVTSVAFTAGFNDENLDSSNSLPLTLSGTTFTNNATNFVGVVYDSNATNQDLHMVWVAGGALTSTPITSLRMAKSTPVLNEWLSIEVHLTDAGSSGVMAEVTVTNESAPQSTFYKHFLTGISRTALMTPHMAVLQHGTSAAHTFDVDYVSVRQSRGTA